MIDKLKVHKFKILGGILGILILAGVVFGAYKLGQRQVQSSPQPIPTATITCGPCPHFVPLRPDFCQDGRLVLLEKDECGCQMPPKCLREGQPIISITNQKGRCQADDDKQITDISVKANQIIFSGTIINISPCDKLSALVEAIETLSYPSQKVVEVYLTNEGHKDACIACLGAIDFSGMVKGVSEGDYTVKIFLNAGGKTISLGQKKVTLK